MIFDADVLAINPPFPSSRSWLDPARSVSMVSFAVRFGFDMRLGLNQDLYLDVGLGPLVLRGRLRLPLP